jgi:hypothetical protein
MPETIDAEVLGMESFLPGHSHEDSFFGAFPITQIDDRSGLKRSLSHLYYPLFPKGSKEPRISFVAGK